MLDELNLKAEGVLSASVGAEELASVDVSSEGRSEVGRERLLDADSETSLKGLRVIEGLNANLGLESGQGIKLDTRVNTI